jgi:hypothetical protein
MFTNISEFLKDYLAPINTLVVPFSLINLFLDFLGDTFTHFKSVVYFLIGMIFVVMITLAIREKRQASEADGLAERLPGRWNRPFSRVFAVLLGVSALLGGISLAYASKGGVITNAYPPLKNVQQSMLKVLLDVKADTGEINAGVTKIAKHMDNPRAQLKSRGYEVTSSGLLEAIKQHDEEAVALFSAAKLKVDQPGPLGFLLDDYWDAKIAGLLTDDMFVNESACIDKHAGWQDVATFLEMYSRNLRPDQPEKAATFKRLCKSNHVREFLEKQVQTMPERLSSKPQRGDSPELLAQYRWALNYLSKL